MPRRSAVALAGAVAVSLAGCGGLPTPTGVRPGNDGAAAAAPEPERIQVLLPGPRPGASAEQIIAGFLDAQRSPDAGHADARQFLAPGTPWDDTAGAVVYRAGTQAVRPTATPGEFAVSVKTIGQISRTGAFRLDLEPNGTLREPGYKVARDPASGELRLTAVPQGVRISQSDLDRSFAAVNVYFLARDDTGTATDRLVADRVFLPVSAPTAQAAVARLLAGPSDALSGAVATAVPPKATLASPVRVQDGVVTVDLSAGVQQLSGPERRRLAAQLVWTLTPLSNLTGVRLLAQGRPLEVPGAGVVQSQSDRLVPPPDEVDEATLLYVRDHRLAALDTVLTVTQALPEQLPVVAGARNPRDGQVAVLARPAAGRPDVVQVVQAGSAPVQVFSRDRLAELSWGSGARGLWVLEPGPSPLVWLVPAMEADPEARPRAVPYDRPAGAGVLTQLQVSRDGTRVAMVFGQGRDAQLFVGTLLLGPHGLRIVRPSPVARSLTAVTDVAWQDGTRLAVLAAPVPGEALVPLIVAVDGSAVTVFPRPGPDEALVALAAAPNQPLAVLTKAGELFRDNGEIFLSQRKGGVTALSYPG